MAASSLSILPYSVGGVEAPKPKFSSVHFSHLPFPLAPSCYQQSRFPKSLQVSASISIPNPQVRTSPDDLVSSILSKVMQTDGGVLLKDEEHKEVADVAEELQKYCVKEPVKCPLIFGEWDVAYCSRPTSPGGGYRSALGRLFFKTNQMIQVVEAPDIVRNKICFSLFGFLDGEVSLKGKLKALDGEWIQVVFEAPELKVGSLECNMGVKVRLNSESLT